jgi:hypothetical protein
VRVKRAPLDYRLNPKRLPNSHYWRLGIAALIPHGAKRSALESILDGRASVDAINNWRYGRTHAPRWANQLLAAKLRAQYAGQHPLDIADKLEQLPERIGMSAGARNLAEWRVKKAREG